ncbi:hypothetical protein GUITHDRAFT_136881 [Guillardia theta CCMP2712]|uniref:CDK5 regulatory subunit associated protein 3 n=1 Tax=Guillardia theta (strain CCMP2712) TaxID=905079 RepID=L1JIR6_GUITC|nr:hypothetical protein GUITHDRAFT_136881 [Guillardia theta CCMP2712]EKX48376.1 hypothetical protein GUITHDRAFT_136881 [Guillardia theta CCMP2712]|eukprot:XP_005835356.1 hypothetical protein GUITHDRAFT_136881 [Guillardia theta CCMP2712]
MAEEPLDVNLARMREWLKERQMIRDDWRASLQAIQDKVGRALEGLPENEALAEVKEGINVKEVNYLLCRKLRDILTSDKDTSQKNWLGQYKNQATKEWETILSLYHKDNVHLAEAAQVLAQNVQFEIPAIQKMIQQCTRQQQELHRKENEYKRGAGEYKARFEAECLKLGIEGGNLMKELLKRSEELPKLYLEMIETAKSDEIRRACELYVCYVRYITEKDSELKDLLPSLSKITQEPLPSLQQMESIAFAEDAVTLEDMQSLVNDVEPSAVAEIDWGDLDVGQQQEETGGIDWGEPEQAAGDGGIDWGDSEAVQGDVEQAAEIDWGEIADMADITVEEDCAVGAAMEDLTGVPFCLIRKKMRWLPERFSRPTPQEGDAFIYCMLSCLTLRSKLLNDIMEIHTFVRARISELQSSEYIAVVDEKRPAELDKETESFLQSCSKRFRERLVSSLEMRRSNACKLEACIEDCQRKRQELGETIRELQPKLSALIQNTRSMQRGTEAVLMIMTDLLKRPVNIVGDINMVLREG